MAGTSYTIRPGDWQALRDLNIAFRKALDADADADLEKFLPAKGDRLRPPALLELIEIDLGFHWQRGRGPLLDDYLKRFPELGPAPGLAVKLVHEEYRLRKLHGDGPSLDTYKRRFPEQYSELENLAGAEATANPVTTPATPNPARAPGPAAAGSQLGSADALATKPKLSSPSAPAVDGPQGIGEGATLPFGGGYTLIDRLGSGSFGEVWRARSAGGGFENAIKVIFRSEDEDVAREVHALEVIRELRHPFLLSTQSFWFLGKRLYIVMELAECSLRQLLRAGKPAGAPVAAADVLSYLRETAEALDFLHSRGVMHRDIKPENILVLEGHVKVADFGVVRLQEGRAESATVLGTPQYMPPEVWGGMVSIHSDQYSLALTYAELRMGRRAYTTSGFPQLMRAHCDGQPELQTLPEPERKVVLRALAKDPERRFPSCRDFVSALYAAVPASAATDDERRQPATRTPRLVYALLLLLLLAAVAGLIWHFMPPEPLPDDTLRLLVEERFRIHAGKERGFPIVLERRKRDGVIVLRCTDLPSDIQVVVIPDSDTEARVSLKVSPHAKPRSLALTFESPGGASATLDLDIAPLATLPTRYQPIGDDITTDITGESYYKTVQIVLGNAPIPFCLVEQHQQDQPRTFYIMRDKVSNDLYRNTVAWLPAARVLGRLAAPAIVGAHGSICSFTAAEAPRWTLGGIRDVELDNGDTMEKPVGALDRLPVLRVTAFEAHRFAHRLGGKLPSINQWDRAAGWDRAARGGLAGREGPFDGDWEILKHDPKANIAVGRRLQGPLSLDEHTKDVSYFGCRYMSGNGFEWTNDLQEPPRKTVSEFAGGTPRPMLMVLLRGMGYTQTNPLLFAKLDDARSWEADDADPQIGFRVVVHAPGNLAEDR